MEINEVKQHIKTKLPLPFYIFTGEELGIMDIYIDKIAEVMGTTPKRADSIADIVSTVTGRSFIKEHHCYVIRDDSDFLKQEKIWEDFLVNDIQQENTIILVLSSLDKRSKFYKAYNYSIVEFNTLSGVNLKRYLAQKISMSDTNADKLIEVCESNYSRMLLEVDKINCFIDGYAKDKSEKMPPDNAFLRLLNDGTIYQPPKDAIFEFVDAVLRREPARAFDLYNQSLQVGESVVVLLSVLYNNTKQVLQVQSCESSDISKSTGLTGWQIKCAKEKGRHYTNGDLVYMMKLIRDCEVGIKTGRIEESVVIPYILTEVM